LLNQTLCRAPLLLFVFAFLIAGCNPLGTTESNAPEVLSSLVEASEERLHSEYKAGLPFRNDGFAYAIDVANTMQAAAVRDDRPLFNRANRLMRSHFLRTKSDDARAQHTVLWRYHPDRSPDASGSKETGRLAEALWTAYQQWGTPTHRDRALAVLDAYLRHGVETDDGRFHVKNYYNYRTQRFAENTWLLNQMPHLVRRIGCATEDAHLLQRADEMARFVQEAYLSDGFFHEMYDPGVTTVIDDATGYFSPNGVLKLQSSLTVAHALLPFDATPAQDFLRFLQTEGPTLYTHYHYDPRTGTIAPRWEQRQKRYWISEQALALDLATALPGNQRRLDRYVAETVVPALRKWTAYVTATDLATGSVPSAYSYEIPLLLESAHRYLHSESKRRFSDPDGCMHSR